jgi:hypothetical protein
MVSGTRKKRDFGHVGTKDELAGEVDVGETKDAGTGGCGLLRGELRAAELRFGGSGVLR